MNEDNSYFNEFVNRLLSIDDNVIYKASGVNNDKVPYKSKFTILDLNTKDGLDKYAKICDVFISSRPPNLLNITGYMLANAAKQALDKNKTYVPPELALAQLALEGGIGNKNKDSRPIKTKNPFNIGNVDSGKNKFFTTVQDSINTYFDLISSSYLKGKDVHDLSKNFVNISGNRYAQDPNYETKLDTIINRVNNISKNITLS